MEPGVKSFEEVMNDGDDNCSCSSEEDVDNKTSKREQVLQRRTNCPWKGGRGFMANPVYPCD